MSRRLNAGEARSSGALQRKRDKQPWPKDRDFRILSIDGGGIKGIFPAAVLDGLEKQLGGGESVADYFDLIAGTSTGGILALGLGAGIRPSALLDLYAERGAEIFPPSKSGRIIGWILGVLKFCYHLARYRYSRKSLEKLLNNSLQKTLFGQSQKRLCIPAFDGKNSEVYVYKTPHHPDYKTDLHERMVTVALATSAAPSYFRPLENNGYILVDGGVWANNPIRIAVTEALTAFDISPEQVKVLSIGCGDDPYVVGRWQMLFGGLIFWRHIIEGAIRLQGLSATNEVRLLLSPQNVIRIDPPVFKPRIELDDWQRSKDLLPDAAQSALEKQNSEIQSMFFYNKADNYIPVETP